MAGLRLHPTDEPDAERSSLPFPLGGVFGRSEFPGWHNTTDANGRLDIAGGLNRTIDFIQLKLTELSDGLTGDEPYHFPADEAMPPAAA